MPWRLPGQLQVPGGRRVHPLGKQAAHRPGDRGEVLLDRALWVDLKPVDESRRPVPRVEVDESHGLVAHRAVPKVAEVVGGVGGDEQHAGARPGSAQGERRGDGRLADPALAADEDDFARGDEV